MDRRDVGALSAEFAGTLLLIVIGLGVEAQVVTSQGKLGNYDSVAWAWGLGVTISIYLAARLSGAHLNPAVTLALAVFKGFPWRQVLPYSLAQLAGAFVGAAVVRFLYDDLIDRVDPDHTLATQGIFSTLPGNGVDGVSVTTAFADQVFGTAVLVAVVCALITASNNPPLANIEPVVVGLLVVAIGMSWGANAGYAINPARDLGPRLLSLMTGYETAMLDQTGYPYFWVPIVGPLVGGVLGAGLFTVAIGRFLPQDETVADTATHLDDAAAPASAAAAPEGSFAAAAAYAAAFAIDYRSWDEDDPGRRAAALAAYFPDTDLASLAGLGWSGHGWQRVEHALPGPVEPSRDGVDVYVRVLFTPYIADEAPRDGTAVSDLDGEDRFGGEPASPPAPRVEWTALGSRWTVLRVPLALQDGALAVVADRVHDYLPPKSTPVLSLPRPTTRAQQRGGAAAQSVPSPRPRRARRAATDPLGGAGRSEPTTTGPAGHA